MATTSFALPGDPPLWGGDCDPEKKFSADDPDLPVAISFVNKMIRDQAIKMFEAKVAPYTEINAEGKKIYRRRHQHQVDAAAREVEEWQRRAKDKVEKYAEVDPCTKDLVIRMKYLDLIY